MFGEPSIFVDGSFPPVRLQNPEGVAVDAAGSVWCGGAAGQIYRIDGDGSSIEQVATTDGFVLGLAFDRQGLLYLCDIAASTVFRFDPASGALTDLPVYLGNRRMVHPNFPVVDHDRGRLLVSDSNLHHVPGGGVWSVDLESGLAELWYGEPLDFANGMALNRKRDALYVLESWGGRVICIPILADGRAGAAEVVGDQIPGVGDGLAVDTEGRVYIACYAPSTILRVTEDVANRYEVIAVDEIHQTLCHPTNIAFVPGHMITANLGGRHLTSIPLPDDVQGAPLL